MIGSGNFGSALTRILGREIRVHTQFGMEAYGREDAAVAHEARGLRLVHRKTTRRAVPLAQGEDLDGLRKALGFDGLGLGEDVAPVLALARALADVLVEALPFS